MPIDLNQFFRPIDPKKLKNDQFQFRKQCTLLIELI